MRSLTATKSKPLIAVYGKPMIEIVINGLKECGVSIFL
ncbi:MAG: hypothetical protein K6F97_01645 [Lachnospiraceae bacterium]|nr:hypothetical protein [Lachnospiraceae bacterium]